MKTNPTFPFTETHPKQTSLRIILVNCAGPSLVRLSLVLFALQTSFAAQRVSVVAPPPLSGSARIQLGTIVVVTSDSATQYSFEKSSGRASSASDGAAAARDEMFDRAREQMGQSPFGPLVAASTMALTPVAAVIGAAKAGAEKVSPGEFVKSENELAEAMAGLGLSASLRNNFLKAADGKLYHPFRIREVAPGFLPGTDGLRFLANHGIATSLELGVEKVRLQRVSSSHASYALFIDARARLVRTQDGTVLYDQPYQFRSGTSLFIDWTLNKGEPMRNVAETGCRYLAEKMVEQLFLAPASGGSRGVQSRSLATGKMQNQSANPAVSAARNAGPRSSGIAQISSPPLDARSLVNIGRIGIVSTSSIPKLSVQRPLKKEQALQEARDSVQEGVEGLLDIPYLNLLGFAAAIPASLGGQSVGALKGVPVHKFEAADAAMDRFVAEMSLQDTVRNQVLQQAREATTHPIELVKKPFPAGQEQEFSRMANVMSGTLAWLPEGQTPQYYLASQGIDTVLELHLLHPALNAEGTINPPMAFNVEVRARLIRVREGNELYSFSMKYRSAERKFTGWAANNAQPLRDEVGRFSQIVAATIIDQLSLRALPQDMPMPLASLPRNDIE